ncbi:MAG: ubiquinone biosynthesis protein UbiB [Candidatus Schekmanbacteria bacterium]|nr:ubiquinone biosynthesis protein UbiB [Candidatus Schekmanbacteria bacterium]
MLPLERIYRGYRNLGRLQHIASVFAKHGFGQLIAQLNLHTILPLGRLELRARRVKAERRPQTAAERLRLAFEELGPTFIKLGQILATRSDIVPADFVAELAKLKDKVPATSFTDISAFLASELGGPVDKLFAFFEPEGFAGASIAQVHHARLWTGERVVVKVQRPGIERTIETDLSILQNLAELLEHYVEEMERYDPVGLVREFSRSIRKELDFGLEASNTAQLGRFFAKDRQIVIPQVHWELSTRRVFTMQELIGIPLGHLDELRAAGHNLSELAYLGGRVFLKQVLDLGLFHADPHAGNVLALSNNPETIGLLDFGMMGRLDRKGIEAVASLVIGLLRRDYDGVVHGLGDLGCFTEDTDIAGFKRELIDFIDPLWGRELKHLQFGLLLTKSMELSMQFKTRLPADMLLLSKALMTIEGIGRELDPDLDLIRLGQPFALKIMARRFDPVRLAEDAYAAANELTNAAYHLPVQGRTALGRLLSDRLGVRFIHVGLDPLTRSIERAATKLSAGMLTSALVLGASWVLAGAVGPVWHGVPVLGAAGLAVAALFATWVVFLLLRGR